MGGLGAVIRHSLILMRPIDFIFLSLARTQDSSTKVFTPAIVSLSIWPNSEDSLTAFC